jgi:hypothetical protein
VTVQADYDVAIYIEDDITTRSQCPEGNNPGADTTTDQVVDGPRCQFPYNDADPTPPPYISEDECNESGNTVKGQQCCDGCVDYWCGYKWCSRGYDYAGTDCNQCIPGDCDAMWGYPLDPINCDPGLPAPPGYDDYTQTASAVIFPEGATDGSWRRVFIFVDGEGGDGIEGNFYLSVEKREWSASPCDRVNDDPRVYDVTNVGASGETFLGSLDNVVNSMHAGSGTCGGYTCADSWSGGSSCHSSSAGNKFWPAEVQFKVDREWGTGDGTYCFMTDESVTNAADLVLTYAERSDPDALSICDETYWVGSSWCRHNNMGSNVNLQISVPEGGFYLFGVGEYNYRNRPCLSSMDNCNFKLTVYEGLCPVACIAPLKTVAGGDINITPANYLTYTTANRMGTLTYGVDTDTYYLNGADSEDEVYKLTNTSGNTVDIEVTLCGTSGDAMIGLYGCDQGDYITYTDSSGSTCETMYYALPPSADPYYLTADVWYSEFYGSLGNYTLSVTWGTPACAAPLGTLAGEFWMSATATPYVVNGDITASNTNAYDIATDTNDRRDEVYVVHNDTGSTKTLSVTHTGQYGPVVMRTILAFYDCNNNYIKHAVAGSGCTVGVTDVYTINAGDTVHVIADTHSATGCCPSNVGNYRITFSW